MPQTRQQTPQTATRPAAPILVVGGTGKTGRRVAQRLEERGLPVRAVSRSSPVPFDWTDPDGWPAALSGAAAAYITYSPDLTLPGAAEAVGRFAGLALDAGVSRLVLLSGRGEYEARNAEQALQDSGAEWTILRASWFAQNFSETFLLDAVLSGTVALPTGDTREPFIDVDDIADVAVAALTEPGHAGQVYEITGPRLLSFAEAVGEIAAASGRAVVFRDIPAADYEAELKAAGLPADYVGLLMYLFTALFDGRNESTTDGVQRALGRPPADFADYVRRTAATGVWSGG